MHKVEQTYCSTDNIKLEQNICLTPGYIDEPIITDFIKSEEILSQTDYAKFIISNQEIATEVPIKEETYDNIDSKQLYTIKPAWNNCGTSERKEQIKSFPFSVKTQKLIHRCDICNELFSNYRHLERHLTAHRRATHIPCGFCKKTFHSETIKDKHIQRCHVHYNCAICNKPVKGRNNFEVHVANHVTPKMFRCSMCNNSYRAKSTYRSHMYNHTGITFECYICGKSSASYLTLKIHLKIHSRKSHQCTICDKVVCSNAYLNIHKLIHEDIKQFSCDICGKKFVTRNGMTKHTRYNHK